MPTSQQKKRHKIQREPEEALDALLQDLVSKLPGTSCETEMAGDWNSLGIAISVPSDYGPRDVLALRNEAVLLLSRAKTELAFAFGWSAGIYRAGQLLEALDQDSVLSGMCSNCGHTQALSRGIACARCGSTSVGQHWNCDR